MIDPLYYCSETVVEGVVVGIRAGSQSQKPA
jgi:hypothetical protein